MHLRLIFFKFMDLKTALLEFLPKVTNKAKAMEGKTRRVYPGNIHSACSLFCSHLFFMAHILYLAST